jgi:1-acyl-sn-glycerol-3-phosphate acyltransferase
MIGVEILRTVLRFGFCTLRRVRVYGAEHVPKEGPVLLAANHVGMLDMFMIGYRLPRLVHWMAKEELFKNKLVARFIRYFGAYPINRTVRDTSAARTTFELLEKGEIVGIFPQGTRAKKGKPVPKAKAGVVKYAVETDTSVLPVAIWGKTHLFGKMYVRFGEPFRYPQPAEGEHYDKKQYLEMAQKLLDDIYAMGEKNQ